MVAGAYNTRQRVSRGFSKKRRMAAVGRQTKRAELI